ncbi:MAG TPA: thiamine phosphate synthase [Desulfotomaculum sp.]|nr:thiamine phosphate synthase [Desulfotomaculum sp.]
MNKYYRIMDANFNRAREGLRVVEEVARFVLNDPGLTMEARELRHRLSLAQQFFPGGGVAFLHARDVAADVGAAAPPAGEEERDVIQLVLANFKRVQEAARVLEEYATLCDGEGPFKEIRYRTYRLERQVVERLRQLAPEDSVPPERPVPVPAGGSPCRRSRAVCRIDCSLYVITGDKFGHGRPIVEVAVAAIDGGATVLQLREKDFTSRQLVDVGHQLRHLTRQRGVTFIVNDRVDIALAVDADGVHLGQDDLPVGMARRILGPGKIIGISTHSLEQALEAQRQGADYIGVGPVYETHTKDDVLPPVGVDLVRQVSARVSIPKVAIGGIKAHNVAEVMKAGADGVAVVTAVWAAGDVSGAARELLSRVREAGAGNR